MSKNSSVNKTSNVRVACKISLPFFREKPIYILVIIFVIATSLISSCIQAALVDVNKRLYDAIGQMDKAGFSSAIMLFIVISCVHVINITLFDWSGGRLKISWRNWLTKNILDRWYKSGAFYGAKLINSESDNPDQRISEDIHELVTELLELSVSFIGNITLISLMLGMLWDMSREFSMTLFGKTFVMHGYLLWICMIYSAVTTSIMFIVGKKMSEASFKQECVEANFRFSLMRTREYSESIAMQRANFAQRDCVFSLFDFVVRNSKNLLNQVVKIACFQISCAQMAQIFPLLLVMPWYLSGGATIGDLTAMLVCFSKVNTGFSWFVSRFESLAEVKAVIKRLSEHISNVDKWDDIKKKNLKLRIVDRDVVDVSIEGLAITLPNGGKLVNAKDLKLKMGGSYLITGPSGSGKSTFMRTLSGLWPFATGSIVWPKKAKIMFLPQTSYIPNDVLYRSFAYCADSPMLLNIHQNEIIELMKAFGLVHLSTKLNISDEWHKILSKGEQQKLALIRAILHKPDIIFLDEATSAMDVYSEDVAYKVMRTRLSNALIVSCGHNRTTLATHHHNFITFTKGECVMS